MRNRNEPSAGIFWLVTPITFGVAYAADNWGAAFMATAFSGLGTFILLFAILSSVRAWRRERYLAGAAQPSGKYPRMDFATVEDFGSPHRSNGRGAPDLFVGVLDGTLLFLPAGHTLSVAITGGGKTSAGIFPNVLNLINHMRVGDLTQALVVNDKEGEVTATLLDQIEKVFPVVACFNPWGLHGLPNCRFNPCQRIIDRAVAGSDETVDVIKQLALLLVAEPEKAGENIFSTRQSRIIVEIFLRGLAAEAAAGFPETCNLVELRRRLVCEDTEHTGYLVQMREGGGELGREAAELLSMKEATANTYRNCLGEARQAVWIFSEESPLAASIQHSDIDLKEFVQRSGYAGIVVPKDKLETYATYVALLVQELAQAGLDYGRPARGMRILADEYGQLPALANASQILTLGRASGTFLSVYLQSEGQLKKYGEKARLFREMADLKTFSSVQNKAESEFLEWRIGQTTLMDANISVPSSPDGDISLSYRENLTPRYRKDQVAQTAWSKLFLVYRDKPVGLIDLCPFWKVQPWRSQATRPNPVEGWPPEDDPAIYQLEYGEE